MSRRKWLSILALMEKRLTSRLVGTGLRSWLPKADLIHDAVTNALIKDGWTITADPYTIEHEEVTLFADLAAERPIADGICCGVTRWFIPARNGRVPGRARFPCLPIPCLVCPNALPCPAAVEPSLTLCQKMCYTQPRHGTEASPNHRLRHEWRAAQRQAEMDLS
jgi:hypothetical protein